MVEFIAQRSKRIAIASFVVLAALLSMTNGALAAVDMNLSYPTNDSVVSDTAMPLDVAISGNTHRMCRIDFLLQQCGLFAPAFTSISNGPHRLDVFAASDIDPTDSTHATAQITVNDTSAPAIGFPEHSPGAVFGGSAYVTIDVGGGSVAECKLDDGSFSPCSSQPLYGDPARIYWNPKAITNEPHTLTVRAKDPAENVSFALLPFSVNDTTQPIVNFAVPDDGSNHIESPVVVTAFANEHVSIQECRIDNGAWGKCPASQLWPIPNGVHTISTRASDLVGNPSAVVSRTVIVNDTTAPTVEITSPFEGETIPVDPSVMWDIGDQPSHADCSLDGAPFSSCFAGEFGEWSRCCESGFSLEGISNGAHTFSVRVTDVAGLTDTDTVNFTVADNDAPNVAFVFPLPNETVPSPFGVWISGQAGECEINVDDGAFAPCGEPLSAAPGPHTIKARVTDDAGNQTNLTRNVIVGPYVPDEDGFLPGADTTYAKGPGPPSPPQFKWKARFVGRHLSLRIRFGFSPGMISTWNQTCPDSVRLQITSAARGVWRGNVETKKSAGECVAAQQVRIRRKKLKHKPLKVLARVEENSLTYWLRINWSKLTSGV